jgi:hypothetical protein
MNLNVDLVRIPYFATDEHTPIAETIFALYRVWIISAGSGKVGNRGLKPNVWITAAGCGIVGKGN